MDTVEQRDATGGWRAVAGKLRALLTRQKLADGEVEAKSDPRRRIALWAITLGAVAGLIQLFLPLEDAYRAIRAEVRSRPATQDTLVVFVDDRSLNALGVSDPKRSDDAKVIDRLFAGGAKRVFFDRAYADATTWPEDKALIDAFERHRGRIFTGFATVLAFNETKVANLSPHPRFRGRTEILSMNGVEGPFGLSTVFPTSVPFEGAERPSISAKLAGLTAPVGDYRVDWAIQHQTIPRASYVSVLNGEVEDSAFAGKDVIIAPSSRTSSDFHPIPFGRKIEGTLLHVMGAQTLKAGVPINLGWVPVFLLSAAFVWMQSRRRKPSRRAILAASSFAILAPLAGDFARVTVDVMPAILTLSIGAVRLRRLAKASYRGSTELRTIDMLQSGVVNEAVDVVALKIRNFATISATLTPQEVEQLLDKALAMLRATNAGTEYSFEKDTIVWLQPRLPQQDLEDHLRGLHALFSTSISVGGQAPDVATAIGADIDHHATLRERVESAMQCAEDAAHAGRIFVVCEPRLIEDRVWRLQILSELENAIRNEDVDVLYQPKFALQTGEIIGAEALMRWNHPTRGMIEPQQVVTIAEEHNRVDMITRFVLNRALSQSREAVAANPAFKIAINISALDLRNPLFVSQVQHLLEAYRFPAGNVILEITETAPIENDDVIADSFTRLKALGVHLSVDDFGIGHASLHYLRRIPAAEVKIDRSFVTGMDVSAEDRALVRSSIEMIHSLGRRAVAEGVESQAVVNLLREMECDAAQGYFFSRPIPMRTMVEKMREISIAA